MELTRIIAPGSPLKWATLRNFLKDTWNVGRVAVTSRYQIGHIRNCSQCKLTPCQPSLSLCPLSFLNTERRKSWWRVHVFQFRIIRLASEAWHTGSVTTTLIFSFFFCKMRLKTQPRTSLANCGIKKKRYLWKPFVNCKGLGSISLTDWFF